MWVACPPRTEQKSGLGQKMWPKVAPSVRISCVRLAFALRSGGGQRDRPLIKPRRLRTVSENREKRGGCFCELVSWSTGSRILLVVACTTNEHHKKCRLFLVKTCVRRRLFMRRRHATKPAAAAGEPTKSVKHFFFSVCARNTKRRSSRSNKRRYF